MLLDRERDADLIGRLDNWKFASAMSHLRPDHSDEVTSAVKALAVTFGNSGWFDGSLGEVVRGAVIRLIGDEE